MTPQPASSSLLEDPDGKIIHVRLPGCKYFSETALTELRAPGRCVFARQSPVDALQVSL